METDESFPRPAQESSDVNEREKERFAVVGIGASAGGIEALQAFFDHLPDAPAMAFVVVQHLSPEHNSELDVLLQAHTPLRVEQVTQPVPLEPGHVYVIPPGKNLSFSGEVLTPTDFEAPRAQRAPVDFFFRALAETHGERAVGILLSGSGTGGTQGLGRIKEYGGITMVQDPNEAGHAGMARSALTANLVDVVAPVAELAEQLVRLRRSALPAPPEELAADDHQTLSRIFGQLQTVTGHDFTYHKRASVLRRLHRRMQVVGTGDLESYLDYLHGHPEEVQVLFKNLLISVTNFFRDPEAFATLEREAIPRLFEDKGPKDEVRVWVPGCATGEEAYSIAILLREHVTQQMDKPGLQVFASDLDEDALRFGREGRYPDAIEGDISEERLKRFFTPEGGGYRVGNELRDMVLFARHNLLGDPPFSKLDLIACRNLFIYLTKDAQEQLFDLFHYALRPGGYLFLGASESLGGASGRFATVDKSHRLYRRVAAGAMGRVPLPQLPLESPATRRREGSSGGSEDEEPSSKPTSFSALHQQFLEAYAPPSAVVNGDGDLVHLSDRVGRYFRLPGGESSQHILDLVHPGLRAGLRSALYRARQERQPAESRPTPVALGGEDEECLVRVTVRPPSGSEAAAEDGFLLVLFDEHETRRSRLGEGEGSEPGSAPADASLVESLEEELRDTRERLQATIEEYETSNEEMKASNEELQSMNEEFKSTTEELETSKEELQSMNEELKTVNQELETKNEELARTRDDLSNLITSTRIATLFLDRDLRLQRFTEAATDFFDVLPADLGRPFRHLTHRLAPPGSPDPRIPAAAEHVLDTLEPVERELRARRVEEKSGEADAGCDLLMRVLPYRTAENRIDGVVLTFVDITRRKEAEDELRALNESLEARVEERTRELHEREASESALLRALPDPVLRISAEGTIEDVHLPDPDALPWTRERLAGQPLREALPQRVAERLSEAVSHARETDTQTLVELIPGGEESTITFEARVAPIDGSAIVALRDISARRRLERELLEAGDRKQQQIAEDLHDDLGQQLLGAHFLCRSLRRRLEDERLAGDIDEIAAEIDVASTYVRNLSHILSAVDAKEGRGLGDALQHLAERTERTFGMTCVYEGEDATEGREAPPISGERVATPLYRIAQEAVTNAMRHSGASKITIRCLMDEEGLMLRVDDDGAGIAPEVAARGDGLGLRTMQHRANLIGAHLDVAPRPNGGTSVSCLLSRSRLEDIRLEDIRLDDASEVE